jgi:hypothetical protein
MTKISPHERTGIKVGYNVYKSRISENFPDNSKRQQTDLFDPWFDLVDLWFDLFAL